MSENSEQLRPSSEKGTENREVIDSQIEKIANKLEAAAELSPDSAESRAEKARNEALESSISVESGGKEREIKNTGHASSRRSPIDRKTREKSYKQTVKRVQTELPTISRSFSKVIHNKVVENTSEALSNTVARPNAILSGAIVAFLLTLATYVTAKTIGYKLSGSETIVAFIVGWMIGLIYDYFRLLLTGKKS